MNKTLTPQIEDELDELIEVPFTLDRNLIMIQVKINNTEDCSFIFDTGTSGIVLSESIVQSHNLETDGYTFMASPNSNMKEKVKNVIIPSLNFNGLNLENCKAVAVKPELIFSPGAAGIIGLPAFNFDLLTIDYQNAKLIFRKGNLEPGEGTLNIDASFILEAKILLNDKKVSAQFDCGAPGYIAIPMEWKPELKLKSEPVLAGKGRTPGGEFEVYRSQLDGEIKIGTIVITDPQISLLTGGFNAVNVGFEFFKNHTITIDPKNKLMQIKPNK